MIRVNWEQKSEDHSNTLGNDIEPFHSNLNIDNDKSDHMPELSMALLGAPQNASNKHNILEWMICHE